MKNAIESILNYTSGKQAATKFNQSTSVEPFSVGISNDSASNEQIYTQFQNETENDTSCKETEIKGMTSYDPVTIELLLSDTRPYQSKSIISGSIQKAMATVDKEEVSKSFEEGRYFVKSYTQCLPHLVSTESIGNILCDEACYRHINVGFCSHAIAVALHTESFEKYIPYLNRTIETTTSFASKKINKRTSGRKKPVQRRMRSLPLSNCKENQFSTSPHIKISLSISRPRTSINLNATSTQKLPFQQNIVYIPPKSYLEQLTSFPQTTFPPAAGSINPHPTINQINTTIFEHD